jgi:hypothetical protein
LAPKEKAAQVKSEPGEPLSLMVRKSNIFILLIATHAHREDIMSVTTTSSSEHERLLLVPRGIAKSLPTMVSAESLDVVRRYNFHKLGGHLGNAG